MEKIKVSASNIVEGLIIAMAILFANLLSTYFNNNKWGYAISIVCIAVIIVIIAMRQNKTPSGI